MVDLRDRMREAAGMFGIGVRGELGVEAVVKGGAG
jgi:hypothetical protein